MRVAVQLTDAGTQRSCTACPATFTVPNTVKLKELAGDPYPSLRPIEKVRQALADRAPPFDGTCHGCEDGMAELQVPIALQVMEERGTGGYEGVRITPGGFSFAFSPAMEQWSSTVFPLLLCLDCFQRFRRHSNHARLRTLINYLLLCGVVAIALWWASESLELSAIHVKQLALLAVIGIVLLFLYRRNRSRSFAETWLRRIKWVEEALDAEEEYRIRVGRAG
jgi:hypothetical protein